jgi:hypothetical protein
MKKLGMKSLPTGEIEPMSTGDGDKDSHIHTYILTYMHTRIHTCIHTYTEAYMKKLGMKSLPTGEIEPMSTGDADKDSADVIRGYQERWLQHT